jgi:hypothetical protein
MAMNDLPAEIICEIFDKDPVAGLQLARTNKWISEVLKYKIKKHRHLIRECNVAAFCYRNGFNEILAKEYRKARKHNLEVTSKYISYFHCVRCFCSFDGYFTFYFLVRSFNEIYETGIILCDKCTLKYYGEERINEGIKTRHSVSIEDLVCEEDSEEDSEEDEEDEEDE